MIILEENCLVWPMFFKKLKNQVYYFVNFEFGGDKERALLFL